MAASLNVTGRHEAGRQPQAALRPTCDSFDRAMGMGITMSASPGKTIVIEGDPIEGCYRVASGALRLFKSTPDGRRQVIDFLVSGEYFGLSSGERYGYSVEAITASTLVRYPRARLEAAMEAQPELAQRMFRMACVELARAQQHLLVLGRKSADEKIASFLLALALRLGDDRRARRHAPTDVASGHGRLPRPHDRDGQPDVDPAQARRTDRPADPAGGRRATARRACRLGGRRSRRMIPSGA